MYEQRTRTMMHGCRLVCDVAVVVWSQLVHRELLDGELANAIPDLATDASLSLASFASEL